MTEKQLTRLIEKYLSGEASEKEKKRVDAWYESYDLNRLEFAHNEEEEAASSHRSLQIIRDRIAQQRLAERTDASKKRRGEKTIYRWMAAAAIAALVLGISYFFASETKHIPVTAASPTESGDIMPGGNKAVLTLANGQQIVLDQSASGTLSLQGNTKVIRLNAGAVAYRLQPKASAGEDSRRGHQPVEYNTITTPRSGRYEVVLPDGSKVWLNAASSLRFPTAFKGTERQVEMSGEAYFEIAKDAGRPFVVKRGHIDIQVLGTQFNVMAYENEDNMKVTLLEGKVKVAGMSMTGGQVLQPGQQVKIARDGEMRLVETANINQVVAWKKNLFWFENDDIEEVAKSLSRWYDVNIDIEGNIPDRFTGSIPMDLPFSKVFEMLQKTGRISYRMVANKTIVVSP